MPQPHVITKSFFAWIPLGFAITVVSIMVYVVIQQDLRQGANDPQIQIAEEAAQNLVAGKPLDAMGLASSVEIGESISPWLTIVDAQGNIVSSTMTLNGKQAKPPAGALAYATEHGQNRITWQPQPGVRQAVAMVAIGDSRSSVAIAGRSLRETEKRVDYMGALVAGAWAVAMMGSYILAVGVGLRQKKSMV